METFLNTYGAVMVTFVVGAQVLIIAVVLALIFRKHVPVNIDRFIIRHAHKTVAIIALVAMLGSLGYSDVFLFQPCKLCWYQRILMYPQVLLLWVGMWFKDVTIRTYSIIMVSVGAFIALYHYLMQFSIVPEGACGTVGYSASCADYFTAHLGYITIPMMALTAFLLMLVLLIYAGKTAR